MSLITKSPHSKKIIVGLDRCLWPFSIERGRVSDLVTPETSDYVRDKQFCLKSMKRGGSKLMIASRTRNPRVGLLMLNRLYPDVTWDGMAIFQSSTKLMHIQRLVRHGESFCLFDHSRETLTTVKKTYGDRCRVFLPSSMHYPLYKEMECIV